MSIKKLRSFTANAFAARSLLSWIRGTTSSSTVWGVEAMQIYAGGMIAGQAYRGGMAAGQVYEGGLIAGQVEN